MNLDDTIVAIATPPGRGGIGVVRLAGPEAKAIALPMLRLKRELAAGHAVFGELVEPGGADTLVRPSGSSEMASEQAAEATPSRAGAPAPHCAESATQPDGRGHPSPHEPAPHETRIDEVVVTYFAGPHSYTTDDIVEISAHGAPVVLRHIVELALARGARLAEPGEFTMRAFLNGRIDLTQAEAVRDLIDSQTLYQAKVAAQQLDGALSRRLQPIKQKLVELIAVLEAGIDFAEDDVSVMPAGQILQHVGEVRGPLEELARSFAYGKLVHEGLTLAIVGRPNVGKSSLFNCLVERERAIVTSTPGTTRDLVTETVAIGGIPVKLVDTAGIRRALDEAESIGIQKSMEALADADLVLVVIDASQPGSEDDRPLLAQVEQRAAIVVENKADLANSDQGSSQGKPGLGGLKKPEGQDFSRADSAREKTDLEPDSAGEKPALRLLTSALTGEGIAELRAAILQHVTGDSASSAESGFLTNARHQSLVRDSLAGLDRAKAAVRNKIPHEMLLLDLYGALRPLDEITGATTNDDILNLIFSRFCIGK